MIFKNQLEFLKQKLIEPKENYALAKVHAQEIDCFLGYDLKVIEDALYDNRNVTKNPKTQEFWFGLDIQSLQTPYSEILEMVQYLNPQAGELWLDLGAGYGRMGVVLGLQKPEVEFVGYEYIQVRVDEGNRIFKKWNFQQAQLKQIDLADDQFILEPADLYFIYDFGSKRDIYQVLEKLRVIAALRPIRVIARGRGIKNWIAMDFPWLWVINEPKHFENWSVYRS